MVHKKVSEGLLAIHQALDSGTDPRQFARQVVDYLRSMMLIKLGNADQVEVTPEMKKQLSDQAEFFALPVLVNTINLFNRAAHLPQQMSWQPALPLELALTEALEEHPQLNKEEDESITHRPAGRVQTYFKFNELFQQIYAKSSKPQHQRLFQFFKAKIQSLLQ